MTVIETKIDSVDIKDLNKAIVIMQSQIAGLPRRARDREE